jgi:phosphomannomutase/phosphoglucomutase
VTIFKACDIRGIVGQEWGLGEAQAIGTALATMLQRRGAARICVAGDFRRTTPELKQSLIQGLVDAGIEVLDLGQLPTPAAYFGAEYLGCRSVAIVTASHNPGRYNGVKFLIDGQPAVPTLIDELQLSMSAPTSQHAAGTVRRHDVLPDYERFVTRHAAALVGDSHEDSEFLRHRNSHIAVDLMGGAAAPIAPRVLANMGYRVTCLNHTIDPDFQIGPPNPAVDSHLTPLRARILETSARLGIALDGDGDRVVFVDAAARIVRPEQIAALLIRHACHAPLVVYDLKCASLVARAARDCGGSSIMRPSGHGFIKSTMIERQADLGVEVSGHHFFAALHGGDDGLFTALVVLAIEQRTGRALHELLRPFPWPLITPDLRIPFTGDAAAVLEMIAAECGGYISRLDGVRTEYEFGWGLARASITEPALTFRFEGRDAESVRWLAARIAVPATGLQNIVTEKVNDWLADSTDRDVAATG